jgi:hypothetical protein
MTQFQSPFITCRIRILVTISILLLLVTLSFITFLANGSSNTYGSLKCYDGHITTTKCTEENNDGSTGTIDADIPSVIGEIPFP